MNDKTYRIKGILTVGILFLMLLVLRMAVDATAAVEEREANKTDISSERGNTPPEVTEVQISPANPGSGDDLLLSYSYSDADGDPQGDTIIRWYRWSARDVQHMADFDNLTVIPAAETSPEDVWYAVVIPHDGQEYGLDVAAHSVVVGGESSNTPPEVRNVYLSPAEPGASDELALYYEYYDADGDLEGETQIRWYRNGTHESAYDGQSVILAGFTLPGEVWHAVVIPHDGQEYGLDVAADSVVIGSESGNTPPEVTEVQIAPANPGDEDRLVLSYSYSDADGDLEGNTIIRWYRDLQHAAAYDNRTVIPAQVTTPGEVWYGVVIPHDAQEYGPDVAAHSVVVGEESGDTPPEVRNVYISPAVPGASDSLAVNYEFYDRDGDPEDQILIRWYRNLTHESAYDGWGVIPAHEMTPGEQWCAIVIPYDGYGAGEAVTNCVTIEDVGSNTQPVVSDAHIQPSRPTSNDDLWFTYTYFDGDADEESKTIIHWYREGSLVSDLDGQSVVPDSNVSPGETWYATIQAHDGTQYGALVTTPAIMINTPPEATNIAITPSEPTADEDLTLSYNYRDVDRDPPSPAQIWWYKNGVRQPEYDNQPKILAAATSTGERWQAAIAPYDGREYGAPSISNKIVTGAGPLHLPLVLLQPPMPTQTPTPTATATPKPSCLRTEEEPNNTSADARINLPLCNGLVIEGRLPDDRDTFDIYRIEVTQPGTIVADLTHIPPATDYHLFLYTDSKWSPIAESTRPGQEAEQITWEVQSGTYYLNVLAFLGRSTEPYLLRVESMSITQPPTPAATPSATAIPTLTATPTATATPSATPTASPIFTPTPTIFCEPNNTSETACGPLISGQTYEAYSEDQDDWYYFVTTETSSLEVEVTNYRAEGQMVLYQEYFDRENQPQRRLIANEGRGGTRMQVPNETDPNALTNLAPGKYLVRIYTVANYSSDQLYRLKVEYR